MLNPQVYLSPDASLKRLEAPYVYQRATDDLLQVSEEAFGFLQDCLCGASAAQADAEFLARCLNEGLLERRPETAYRRQTVAVGDTPSLRYLLVHLTSRCNLSCAHCYCGAAGSQDLSVFGFRRMLEEFEAGGGLRLTLSGGEPLLHPFFWQLNDMLPGYDLRVILCTNGTLLDRRAAMRLNVHEVRVSLDGLETGHDAVRGPGSFGRALEGLRMAREVGLPVSVASTVNALNLGDFRRLATLVADLDVWQWTIDVPAQAGRLLDHPELQAPLDEAVAALDYAIPAGTHNDNEGHLCGAHMATVLPDGSVAKCGLLSDVAGGILEDGLHTAWMALPHLGVESLGEPCQSCAFVTTCRGGCRYRAGGLHSGGPDPVQCRRLAAT